MRNEFREYCVQLVVHATYEKKELMLNRSLAILFLCLVLASGAEASVPAEATPATPTSNAGVRETSARGESVEMHLPSDQAFTPWLHDPAIFKEEQGDRGEATGR